MKKRLLVLVTFVLALTLCACGGGGTGAQNPSEQGGNSQEVVQPKTITVHVTINPEFTLTLDEEMNILSAKAENEDAEALLSGLELAGKPYADGMGAVLSAAHEQGYLSGGGQVAIQVDGKDYSPDLMEALEAPVAQFEEESGIVIQADREITPETLPASLEELPTSMNTWPTYHKMEIDGQTYYVDKRLQVDGNIYYQFFTDNPEHYRDATQIHVMEICVSDDKTTTYYLTNGVITRQVNQYPDGRRFEYEHDSEGNLILRERYYPEDYVEEITYEDGSRSEITYYSNGNRKTEAHFYPDPNGHNEFYSYYENGGFSTIEWIGSDGHYSLLSYSENGVITREFSVAADGTKSEYTYHSNGKQATHSEIWPDGTQIEMTFYANGNCATSYIISPDGSTYRVYNEDGIPTEESNTFADGTYQEITYHSNGNIATCYEIRPDGSTYRVTYNKDGSIASQENG